MDKLLNDLYYNVETGFISAQKLYTKAKLINHTLLGSASCELGKWEQIDKQHNDTTKLL